MKNLLTFIIAIAFVLLGNLAYANGNWTTFNVDEKFFEVTNFSENDYSTIHFGTWDTGNSLGGVIFWWPKIDKEITLKMNWQSIYCKKQIRGFYINQARWNIAWPLDNTTLRQFKWNLSWYQNLSINWWFFTHCTGDLITDYNWIFWYVKHTTTNWLKYELWAWIDYSRHALWHSWWDSLWQEFNLDTKDFFIKWILYDSYGGIWFIDSLFHYPIIIRNTLGDDVFINLTMSPDTTSIWWEVDYVVEFWNNLDFYLDNVKVYLMLPDNVDGDWENIWDLSGNKLLLYNWDLYPLQSRRFTFKLTATNPWDLLTTWILEIGLVKYESIDTWFVANTELTIKQSIIADSKPIMIWDRVTYDITLYNNGNITSSWILLINYLPDGFNYNNMWYPRYSDNALIIFSGDLGPGDSFNTQIRWYFYDGGVFKNVVKAEIPDIDTISSEISANIYTNICGDWILEKDYEYCDDWDNNGKIWYCNDSCTKIVWAGVACKYTDANYLVNGPFMDTVNHWWFKYIETMRKSCLHRWKWTFASQWKYDPDEYITKAEVLKTLVKIRGMAFDDFNIVNEDYPYDWVQVFADVAKGHWFSWYSFYAYDHGITEWLYTQNGNKKYLNPDWTITRNQIIKAIMLLYKEIIDDSEIDISGKSKLVDIAQGSSYYYQYVREAEELWIIWWYDMPNGTKMWLGNNPLTRAEFAKIVSIPFEQVLFESE